MTKHTAKKIDAGLYTYRGTSIEKVDSGNGAIWLITWPEDETGYVGADAMDTLRDAKWFVDMSCDGAGIDSF